MLEIWTLWTIDYDKKWLITEHLSSQLLTKIPQIYAADARDDDRGCSRICESLGSVSIADRVECSSACSMEEPTVVNACSGKVVNSLVSWDPSS